MILMHNELQTHKNNNLIKTYENDMGYDIRSGEDIKIPPRSSLIVNTFMHISMPPWLGMIIKSRARLAFKHDIETSNAGVVAGFDGGLRVKLYNVGFNDCFVAEKGHRIAQAVFFLRPEGFLNTLDRIKPFTIQEKLMSEWPESSSRGDFSNSGRE